MDLILILSIVCICIVVSFFCSMSEAALFAVPVTVVRQESEVTPSASGRALAKLKGDISSPISALLIVNTLANTAGPAFAGALTEDLYGKQGLLICTLVMSALVLCIGEVLPKFLGVTYNRQVALVVARPLLGVIAILRPAIIFLRAFTERFEPQEEAPAVSHEEVLSMTAIGHQEGTIDQLEGAVISNVIGLDRVRVSELLTPRISVFKLPENETLGSLRDAAHTWSFTRIPVYSSEDADNLTGYVRQRDVLRGLLLGQDDTLIGALKRPLHTVPELMRADKLLMQMFEQGEHLYSVVDEHGTLAGIISMEDILEHIVGREINDEYDK